MFINWGIVIGLGTPAIILILAEKISSCLAWCMSPQMGGSLALLCHEKSSTNKQQILAPTPFRDGD